MLIEAVGVCRIHCAPMGPGLLFALRDGAPGMIAGSALPTGCGFFPNTVGNASNVWSASPSANNSNNAWIVNFNNGNSSNNNRDNNNGVRLVRSGE